MDVTDAKIPDSLHWAAFVFRIDRVTGEATAALREAGIESIVVKGPAIATWLFTAGEPRLYTDSDLLIQRRDWSRAHSVLAGLGFEDGLGHLAHPRMESGAGYPWKRSADQAEVDLHYTLYGLGAQPEAIWSALIADATWERVGGEPVRFPSHPARLLHIALHAVQHGGEKRTQSMRDLERAVTAVPVATWAEALALAERLDGLPAFAAGLTLTPEGRSLGATLGVPDESSVKASLRLEDVPTSEGFAELAEARGAAAKLRLLWREAFPTPSFMRWWTPLARRGRLGLAAAYCRRLVWLSFRAIPGYRAWRAATRRAAR